MAKALTNTVKYILPNDVKLKRRQNSYFETYETTSPVYTFMAQ